MDPIRVFIDTIAQLRPPLPPELRKPLEARIRAAFDAFELVPRHEYVAHLEILRTLEAQVQELEARLAALEQPAQD